MKITGKTKHENIVVSEIFSFYDSLGLPLEDIILILKERNIVIDWISLYEDAISNGWLIPTFFEKITPILEDLFDKEYKNVVISSLIYYVRMKQKEEDNGKRKS